MGHFGLRAGGFEVLPLIMDICGAASLWPEDALFPPKTPEVLFLMWSHFNPHFNRVI